MPNIENFLSELRAELQLQLQKWFSKHPSKKFFSFRIPESPPKGDNKWRYRFSIKNLTAHYNSHFCVSFHLCFHLARPLGRS